MEVKEGYKKTAVGVIPSDWEVKLVGESFLICNNLRLPISEEIRKSMQGSYPYYGPTKIQDYINEYRVEGEYSLIGEDGDHFLKWKTMPMTLLVNGRFNVNNHAHLIKGRKNETITKWFYNYFKNRDISQFLTRQGAGRYKLSKSTLITIPCAIPPLPEQKAIAEVLSDADNLIQALEKRIAKKRLIKQGAMQKLLTPKEDWEVKKLGEVVDRFANGGTPSTQNSDFWEGNIPWITGADILNQKVGEIRRYITKEAVKNSSTNVIKKGNLLVVTRTGVGKLAIAPFDISISQDFTGIYAKKDELLTNYLFLFFDFNKAGLQSQNQGTSIKGITRETLSETQIPLPPLPQQKAIAEVLSDMDKEIEALEKKLEKYKLIKQGLMQNLLTGKIRLKYGDRHGETA
ncbi:restriction endonuclease subunit S [Desulfococcaceae bacterium HSG8]|nr:restriction endonuclease subunit S [Desulfococcaceae bacterium HSG8]